MGKMDQTEYQNQQSLAHQHYSSIDTQLLKKVTKILLSVSVFSFCFSNSSLLSFLHSFNFYFSTFPYQLFTHRIDKNSIFLICNLLLVVLAKCSGLIRSPSRSYRVNDEISFKNIEGGSEFESPILLETEELVLQKEDGELGTVGSLSENVAAEEEKEKEFSINRVEKDTEKEVEKCREPEPEPDLGFIVSEEEENGRVAEEDESGNVWFSSSTEELNKKFEDFIRRMKEDLRIEAQRQLIMV